MLASTVGTLVISPLLFAVGLAVYIDSGGPVLYSYRCIGANGRPFTCFKFRSMVQNADILLKDYLANNHSARREWDQDRKLKKDPRITKVGRFLRRTSLDELPQLLNVIKGEMSLVGPRQIVAAEIPKYGVLINDYYSVRPGMTGYWQVNGRNDIDYNTRVEMVSWYVRNWSIWLDLVILFKTIGIIFRGKGAY